VLGKDVPQVAVFDTALHRTLSPEADTYPGPAGWLDEGIRRFGFHGISHPYVARRASQLRGRPRESLNLISCHLGNGASLAAIRGGSSIDTTHGIHAPGSLMMGTRPGSIDPVS
jgi:acetate kinase